MTIVFKQCISENSRIPKQFVDGNNLTLTGTLRAGCSIMDPVFVIESTGSTDISSYNYFTVSAFNRNYFIKNITVKNHMVDSNNVAHTTWEIVGHIDVLESYKTGILNCTAMVEKNEEIDKSNLYINDSTFYTECRNKITTHHFITSNGSAFEFSTSNDSYLLAVLG